MNDLIDKLREAIFKPSLQAQQAHEVWIKNYPHGQGWKQNSDGSYDVKGSVDISHKNLTKLPWKFRRVGGKFYCYNNQLTTLEGAPQHVGGFFSCNNNQLTSLEGAPQHVGGYFSCNNNPVPSSKLKTTVKRRYLQE